MYTISLAKPIIFISKRYIRRILHAGELKKKGIKLTMKYKMLRKKLVNYCHHKLKIYFNLLNTQ